MPMPPYTVVCSHRGCKSPALFKIAARWSDGITQEFKTYGLSCADCLATELTRARTRRATCRLAPRETLEPPGVYELERGQHDYQLRRRTDLERGS